LKGDGQLSQNAAKDCLLSLCTFEIQAFLIILATDKMLVIIGLLVNYRLPALVFLVQTVPVNHYPPD